MVVVPSGVRTRRRNGSAHVRKRKLSQKHALVGRRAHADYRGPMSSFASSRSCTRDNTACAVMAPTIARNISH